MIYGVVITVNMDGNGTSVDENASSWEYSFPDIHALQSPSDQDFPFEEEKFHLECQPGKICPENLVFNQPFV